MKRSKNRIILFRGNFKQCKKQFCQKNFKNSISHLKNSSTCSDKIICARNLDCKYFCIAIQVWVLRLFVSLTKSLLPWFTKTKLPVVHFKPLFSFYIPMKITGNLWLADVFRGYGKRPVTWNSLLLLQVYKVSCKKYINFS